MASVDPPADTYDDGTAAEPPPSPHQDFALLWTIELDDCPPAPTFDPMDQQ